MLVVLLAYQFHHLSLLGIPLYFLYKVRIGPISIIFSLVMAMLLSQLLAGSISGVVDGYSQDLNYDTYVQGEYVEEALGLRNPMIYFQIVILMVYTFMEPVLASKDKFYYLFRWAYFYSTLILIFSVIIQPFLVVHPRCLLRVRCLCCQVLPWGSERKRDSCFM